MTKKYIFDKRNSENIVYYDGNNAMEVIQFFQQKNYGKFLFEEDGKLYYKVNSWETKSETIILQNNYITFAYDDDDWWYVKRIPKHIYDLNFVSIEIDE